MSWSLSAQECAAAIEGCLEVIGGSGLADLPLEGVGTDSRTDLTGRVFIALVGDSHDAHCFLLQAVENKARSLIVHRDLLPNEKAAIEAAALAAGMGIAVIRVDDTLKALQGLARHWRHKCRALFIGITGTNGKTSTKEFAAAMIGSKFKVQWSKGSFNNHWGLPLSILSVDSTHDVAVMEMGMNHPGELKLLSKIVDADVVVCTMVGRGHLEGVGSIAGAAAAKAEIYEYASPGATFIFNLDNEYTAKMHDRFLSGDKGAERRSLSFSISGGDVSFRVTAMTNEAIEISGQIRGLEGSARVPVFGEQNAVNLMAAASLALAAGLTPKEIWASLPLCRSAWGRNQWVKLKSGAQCLFDGYNANPESMQAALSNVKRLSEFSVKRAVLGEMRELGEHTQALHEELGASARAAGLTDVLFFGPSASAFRRGFGAGGVGDSTDVDRVALVALVAKESIDIADVQALGSRLKAGDLVLIKGSRGVGLEEALFALEPLDFDPKT